MGKESSTQNEDELEPEGVLVQLRHREGGEVTELKPWTAGTTAMHVTRHQWGILATAQIGGAMPSDSGACQRTRTLMVWTKTDSDDQAGRGQTAGGS